MAARLNNKCHCRSVQWPSNARREIRRRYSSEIRGRYDSDVTSRMHYANRRRRCRRHCSGSRSSSNNRRTDCISGDEFIILEQQLSDSPPATRSQLSPCCRQRAALSSLSQHAGVSTSSDGIDCLCVLQSHYFVVQRHEITCVLRLFSRRQQRPMLRCAWVHALYELKEFLKRAPTHELTDMYR